MKKEPGVSTEKAIENIEREDFLGGLCVFKEGKRRTEDMAQRKRSKCPGLRIVRGKIFAIKVT